MSGISQLDKLIQFVSNGHIYGCRADSVKRRKTFAEEIYVSPWIVELSKNSFKESIFSVKLYPKKENLKKMGYNLQLLVLLLAPSGALVVIMG